jgi:hypothetical protein
LGALVIGTPQGGVAQTTDAVGLTDDGVDALV